MQIQSKSPLVMKLDVKRLYIPGTVITDACPSCGVEKRVDLGNHPLSFPNINAPSDIYFYCGACDEADRRPYEWTRQIIIRFSIEEVQVTDPPA
jgi:hypothetical protein